jgi:hypothetical protein
MIFDNKTDSFSADQPVVCRAKIKSLRSLSIPEGEGGLLPILNKVYTHQVKVKDSMKSMWLTYIFSRATTREDVEVIQRAYEDLGYKVDESEEGRLYVSKISLTLYMTFSI